MPNKDLFSLDDLTESASVPTGDDGDGNGGEADGGEAERPCDARLSPGGGGSGGDGGRPSHANVAESGLHLTLPLKGVILHRLCKPSLLTV